jgi:ribosome-associated translation inhibitor RaiA
MKQEAMDVLIRTEGVFLSDTLRDAVIRKMGRVRQYAPRALRARVLLHKTCSKSSAHQFRARVHYEIPGNDLFAEQCAHEPMAAIDLLAEKKGVCPGLAARRRHFGAHADRRSRALDRASGRGS